MSIDVDRETQHLIQQELNRGHFRDASSLVGTAVRHLVVSREELGYSRDEIDAMIDRAASALERGEGVDGEEFFAQLEGEEAQLRSRR